MHHLTQNIPTCWYILALPVTPTPDASQWNMGGVGSSGVDNVYFMYISCKFHVVCASFSVLATRELANANPVSSGIWALVYVCDLITGVVGECRHDAKGRISVGSLACNTTIN